VPGVVQAQRFGTERAMRLWADPAKLEGFRLGMADVTAAFRAQNAQVASGSVRDLSNVASQGTAATVVVRGQLATVEQFGNIVLRASTHGCSVRLKGGARQRHAGRAAGVQLVAQQAQADAEARRRQLAGLSYRGRMASQLGRLNAKRSTPAAGQAVLQVQLAQQQSAPQLYRVLGDAAVMAAGR